jgi:dUTP pyrophosphatase
VIIEIKKLNENAIIPQYKTKGAAGFDFHSTKDAYIPARTYGTFPTGLAFEIPQGYELEIRSRSGLAFKEKVFAFNGTIDSDYRGEITLMLYNDTDSPYQVKKGDRIAQGIIKKVKQVLFVEVDELKETERGEGGFGSTGL